MSYPKTRFSRAQRAAYESGKGYAVAHSGKQIDFAKPEVKESFAAGFRKGKQMMKRNPLKYADLPKPKKTRTKKKKG